MKHLSPHDLAQMAGYLLIAGGSISFIGAIYWIIWLTITVRREGKRSREGLCMKCGYDLRQSRDRCPECGEPIRQ